MRGSIFLQKIDSLSIFFDNYSFQNFGDFDERDIPNVKLKMFPRKCVEISQKFAANL
jgi:hypothetical protein